MPGTTPDLGIPFALATDPLSGWPTVNQELSEKIEELMETVVIPQVGVKTDNGIGGDGSDIAPVVAETSGVFGTAPLSTPPFAAEVQDFGDEVYLDTLGKLRVRPQLLWKSLNADALPSAYPLGQSILSVGPENVLNWPSGWYGAAVTVKRMESGATLDGMAQQWFYRHGGADVLYRWAVNDAGGWSTWVSTSPEDTGWKSMTPSSGTGQCQYRCRNGVVTVRLNLSGMTAIAPNNAGTIVAAGVLPAAYIPGVSVYQAGSAGGSGMSLGAINAGSGSISQWNPAYNSGGLTLARLTFTYLKE